ncbi:hypothetical protein Brsp01_31710 [Brucella sp. NBRC 12950]|nr:hypothetical protein Brsp01_31710 [Brucella sp. NBRC 12950]
MALQLGFAPNYDTVTSSGQRLRASLDGLKAQASVDPRLAPMLDAIQTYRDSVDHKAWLFEQVKASYAMLRNSVTVIPDAVTDFYTDPDSSTLLKENKRASDYIAESTTSMMSFTIAPTALLRQAVDEQLSSARNAAKTASPALAQTMNRFISQLEVAVRERLRGTELMLQITQVPTAANADQIAGMLHSIAATEKATRQTVWGLIVVLSAITLIIFSIFAYVVVRRFVKLDNDNRLLQQVNENVEEQLVQSAKLSALGQMVAGITHEINTPLAYVKAVFELLKERMLTEESKKSQKATEEEEERREELMMLLDDGLHGLNEIATLVRTMKNFSRLDKGTIEPFIVEEGIESALLLARPQLKYVADVQKDFDNVPPVMASPTQIRQVLLNLIVNAADAMATCERRGVLTLRTRITSSDTVQIEVCDNGPGIPEHILPKLFDPFFTTKPVGQGTGMGLSICYRIIENHGGTIALNSKAGKGTVVTITLPRQDEKQQPTTIPEISFTHQAVPA